MAESDRLRVMPSPVRVSRDSYAADLLGDLQSLPSIACPICVPVRPSSPEKPRPSSRMARRRSESPPYCSSVISLRKLAYFRMDPSDVYRYRRDVKNAVYRVDVRRCCKLAPWLRTMMYRRLCTWDPWLTKMGLLIACASRHGHLDCLQVAMPLRQRWTSRYDCDAAAYYGHLECVRFLHGRGCRLTRDTCSKAARNGHVECLRWAREHGGPWSATTCYAAARNGHLECLAWARGRGCPWDERTFHGAAARGHVDCAAYAYLLGCPYDRLGTVRRLEHLLGGERRVHRGQVDDDDLPILECLLFVNELPDYVVPPGAAAVQPADARPRRRPRD